MGLFDKNNHSEPGEKHFLNVIKNTGPGEYLFWKNPEEDFNFGSTLIVSENEQALFVRDGLVEQVFDGGRYTLEADNYPFLSRLRNVLSGGVSSFHCKVYYVRLADTKEITWGTPTPIQLRDPVLGIPVSIQARGSYRVRIADAKRFYLKMVGNNESVFTQNDVTSFCQSQFNGIIKSTIAKQLRHSQEEILGVSERQDEFAAQIEPSVGEFFEDYGFHLVNFCIESLDIPMDDPYRQKVEMAHAERLAMLQTGQAANLLEADRIDQIVGAQGRAFETLGANWGRQQSADILNAVASNPNSGGLAAAGAGFGMGIAAGGAIGSMAQNLFMDPNQAGSNLFDAGHKYDRSSSSGRFMRKDAGGKPPVTRSDDELAVEQKTGSRCPSCGASVPLNAKFCMECGEKISEVRHCSQCGAKVPVSANFCPECGSKKE